MTAQLTCYIHTCFELRVSYKWRVMAQTVPKSFRVLMRRLLGFSCNNFVGVACSGSLIGNQNRQWRSEWRFGDYRQPQSPIWRFVCGSPAPTNNLFYGGAVMLDYALFMCRLSLAAPVA